MTEERKPADAATTPEPEPTLNPDESSKDDLPSEEPEESGPGGEPEPELPLEKPVIRQVQEVELSGEIDRTPIENTLLENGWWCYYNKALIMDISLVPVLRVQGTNYLSIESLRVIPGGDKNNREYRRIIETIRLEHPDNDRGRPKDYSCAFGRNEAITATGGDVLTINELRTKIRLWAHPAASKTEKEFRKPRVC